MPYKVFHLDSRSAEAVTEELNEFLHNHKIIAIEKQFMQEGTNGAWAFLLEYHDDPKTTTSAATKNLGIDYREILSEDDFGLYSKLRAARKNLATAKGLPLFAVFKNEQLAEMAKIKPVSSEALKTIAGVGEGRIAEYGQIMIDIIKAELGESKPPIAF